MASRFPAARNRLTRNSAHRDDGRGCRRCRPLGAGSQIARRRKARRNCRKRRAKLPKVGADKTRGLDFLFGALKAAPDEASAKHVEARIWALWLQTPSDTTALLMLRAKAAMDAKQMDVALKLLDAVVKLRPDYVEGWNRRATLYYLQNDYAHSLEDIGQVLMREPRHFGALAGLGMIMQEIGDEKHALDAFRKALAVNPHLERCRNWSRP